MKIVVFLTLFSLLRLSLEYHQTDYIVVFERYNLISINKDYVDKVDIVKKFVTRHDVKYNLSCQLLQDVDAHFVDLHIEARKFQSNEYRLFPFNYTENSCLALNFPKFGDQLKKYDTNFKRTCDVKKGHYYVRNIYVDDSEYPPFAPRGRYKLTMHLSYNKSILLGAAEYFIQIKPTNPLERTIGA